MLWAPFVFVLFWLLTFKRLTKAEVGAFLVCNLIYSVGDIGAVQNGVFAFTNPSALGLPYWEFVFWGYWLLHMHRMLHFHYPKHVTLKSLLLAISFFLCFSLLHGSEAVLVGSGTVLLVCLLFFHTKEDIFTVVYMIAMGLLIENFGLRLELWNYPQGNSPQTIFQYLILWGTSGLLFRQIAGPFLREIMKPLEVIKWNADDNSPPQVDLPDTWVKFTDGYEQHQRNLSPTHWTYLLRGAELAAGSGNLRGAIQLTRSSIDLAPSKDIQAQMYLQLCRYYRMMVLMKNARLELLRAFECLGMEFPENFSGQTVCALVKFIWHMISPLAHPMSADQRNRFQVKVALWEEAGLSGYYLRQDLVMIQALLNSRAYAVACGESVEKIDFQCGSACIAALLGWRALAEKQFEKAKLTQEKIGSRRSKAKLLIWEGLGADYSNQPIRAEEKFREALSSYGPEVKLTETRMTAATLACNLVLRGHMKESLEALSYTIPAQEQQVTQFALSSTYVQWYRIPALSFLGESEEIERILDLCKGVFAYVDEEQWQLTQYIGNLLIYYYVHSPGDTAKILDVQERFKYLKLTPQKTFLEACHFWVARAYANIELFERGEIRAGHVKQTIRDLFRTPDHPAINAHKYLIRGRYELLCGERGFESNLETAEAIAQQTKNEWALFEVLRTRSRGNDDLQRQLFLNCEQKGWKGWLHRI